MQRVIIRKLSVHRPQRVQHHLDRVCAQGDAADVQKAGCVQRPDADVQGREKTGEEHDRLQQPTDLPHQKNFRRSIPSTDSPPEPRSR